MPPYDPATVEALESVLAARADDLRYNVEVVPTPLKAINLGRYPAALSLGPGEHGVPYLVAYLITYRRILWSGGFVIALPNRYIARGILAEDAMFQLSRYDLLHPVTEFTPGGRGVVSGP